jgi:hypothetical protein
MSRKNMPAIFQGQDVLLAIASNIDASSYTEVEFRMWAGWDNNSVTKKLSDGDISVTTSNSKSTFNVTIADTDTDSLQAGDYRLEMRGTDSTGAYRVAEFRPNRIRLLPSSWSSLVKNTGSDYTRYP